MTQRETRRGDPGETGKRVEPAEATLYGTGAQGQPPVPAQEGRPIRNSGRPALHPSRANLVVTHLILIVTCLIFFFPLYWILVTSLKSSGALLSSEFSLLPQGITLANYARALSDSSFLRSLLNSFIYAGGTTLVSIVVGCSAAYAYSRMRFVGRRPTLWAMIILQAFPGIAIIVPLYVLFTQFGLVDTYQGLIIAYTASTLPFAVWMLKSYFDTIPRDLEDAAKVDGCTTNQAFVKVVLPLALPALAITALFGFVLGWTEFVLAITFINTESLQPLSVQLYSVIGQRTTEWGFFAAQSVLFALPVVVFFLIFQRFLIGGLTVGGVKG
jgi:arabinogalactan oligomer/maltooligosaccharide transport system permease protein